MKRNSKVYAWLLAAAVAGSFVSAQTTETAASPATSPVKTETASPSASASVTPAPAAAQSAAAATQPAGSVQTTPAAVPAQKKQVSSAAPAKSGDALLYYQNGKYADAIAICEQELTNNPERVESYVVLCWALIKNKQYAEAEQRAQDGLKVSPYDLRLVESLGESKYYLGKNNGAMEQFQKYVANAPESGARVGTAYYYMGEIYIRQARYQHADISLTAAVKKEPLLDRWWTRLGYAREKAGNYYESVNAYDEALKLNPSSEDAATGRKRVSERLQ